MLTLYVSLFIAGVLTILLPCILPLIPVVVGVSVTGKNRWRPLLVVLGMVVSFVLFTFLLLVVLRQFIELADLIRIAMFVALLLFGFGFAFQHKYFHIAGAVLGGFYFYDKGPLHVVIAVAIGIVAMFLASKLAARVQQTGLATQQAARGQFGEDSPLTAFIIGLTLGLIWVPCAGPALGFALTLVRDEPGLKAILALTFYALGTALPLILIGYGGQRAVHSVRALAPYTGVIKRVAGALLILTSVALQFRFFENIQIFLLENTSFGSIGTSIEESLFKDTFSPLESEPAPDSSSNSSSAPPPPSLSSSLSSSSAFLSAFSSSSSSAPRMSSLPKITRAPAFSGLGPWHNSVPLSMEDLKGKVVLVDFWTYSCINCIRTFPYIQGYHEKYKDTGKFVIVAVHAPEFAFEKSEKNVAKAIKEHGLTYPVAQDNNFSTWSAYANRYWPAKYLIDANGYIRYTHFGEGNYEETDKAIAALLEEAGVTSGQKVSASTQVAELPKKGPLTPETYMSSRSWPAFGNAIGDPNDDVTLYSIPKSLRPNSYYLAGEWQLVDDEYQALRSSTGEIRMQFTGGEMNLVLGIDADSPPVKAQSFVDGKLVREFTVDHHDLYNLFSGDYGTHDLALRFSGEGVQAFAFTFGVGA